MELEYLLSQRTGESEPLEIFKGIALVDQDLLYRRIKLLHYAAFLKSNYWLAVSHVCKARARGRCQVCNSENKIQAHHRTYSNHGSEHDNMCDLTALCDGCHALHHGLVDTPKEKPAKSKSKPAQLRIKKPRQGIEPICEARDGYIVLTAECIEACSTSGTISRLAAKHLGLRRAKKGWKKRLLGKVVSISDYETALKLKPVVKSNVLIRGVPSFDPRATPAQNGDLVMP